jgi:aryl-alcohol dehydrogenase-like predicted oxidoreductase
MVTKIGLGLAALGRPGYINLGHAVDLNHNYDQESMESHAHQIMELAYNKGIRYFDAARSYGKAEEFLANW